MYVRDIMTTNVVTIPSDTSVLEARRILDQKNLKRLPVVDGGKLVGIVTSRMLEKATPPEPEALSNSMWDVAYNLMSFHRMSVERIMRKRVVTVTPGMTVEEAVALAQGRRVGALLVIEKGNKLVGMVTTNDFFYRIVNPVLGIGVPGCRIEIAGGGEGKALEEIISIINKSGLKIITLHVMSAPDAAEKDIVVHVDGDNVSELIAELNCKGYKVDQRKR